MSEALDIGHVPQSHEPVVSPGIDPSTGGIVDEEQLINEQPQTGNNDEQHIEQTEQNKPTFDVAPYQFDDKFGLTDEVITSIQPSLERFQNAGLSQEQMNVVMEELLGANDEQAQTQAEPDYLTNLNNTLTHQEKMNYDNVANFANDIYADSEFDVGMLMQDPYAVKMLNMAFMKTVGQPQQTLHTPQSSTKGLNQQEAQAEYINIMKKANVPTHVRNEQIESLIEKTGNSDWAKAKYSKHIRK